MLDSKLESVPVADSKPNVDEFSAFESRLPVEVDNISVVNGIEVTNTEDKIDD